MPKLNIVDIFHRGFVFSIVGFCVYATAETCFTINSAIETAKHRMDKDKQEKIKESNVTTKP